MRAECVGSCRYEFQLSLGRKLADRVRERNWDIDCIVPVPDGSRPAAIELSAALNLPYREGLVKNRYVGRTFIMPDQNTRELSVRRKLNAMPAVFRGKSVLLVDDSIVRGTTMSQIVDMVRRAGAKRVYLASASPPVKYPNVYGAHLRAFETLVLVHACECLCLKWPAPCSLLRDRCGGWATIWAKKCRSARQRHFVAAELRRDYAARARSL